MSHFLFCHRVYDNVGIMTLVELISDYSSLGNCAYLFLRLSPFIKMAGITSMHCICLEIPEFYKLLAFYTIF